MQQCTFSHVQDPWIMLRQDHCKYYVRHLDQWLFSIVQRRIFILNFQIFYQGQCGFRTRGNFSQLQFSSIQIPKPGSKLSMGIAVLICISRVGGSSLFHFYMGLLNQIVGLSSIHDFHMHCRLQFEEGVFLYSYPFNPNCFLFQFSSLLSYDHLVNTYLPPL